MDGELMNMIGEEYASEVISLMILERLWTKVKRHLDDKGKKKLEAKLEERLSNMEKDIAVNTAIDKRRDKEK